LIDLSWIVVKEGKGGEQVRATEAGELFEIGVEIGTASSHARDRAQIDSSPSFRTFSTMPSIAASSAFGRDGGVVEELRNPQHRAAVIEHVAESEVDACRHAAGHAFLPDQFVIQQ
jgi:hypothetical protein